MVAQKRRKDDKLSSIKNLMVIIQFITLFAVAGGSWFVLKYRVDQMERDTVNPELIRKIVKEEISVFDDSIKERINSIDTKYSTLNKVQKQTLSDTKKDIQAIQRALYRKNIM